MCERACLCVCLYVYMSSLELGGISKPMSVREFPVWVLSLQVKPSYSWIGNNPGSHLLRQAAKGCVYIFSLSVLVFCSQEETNDLGKNKTKPNY